MIAAAIAFVVGLAVNYALSIWFVFSESSKVKNKVKEFVVYGIIGLIGLLITEGIMYLFTDVFGLYFLISKNYCGGDSSCMELRGKKSCFI